MVYRRTPLIQARLDAQRVAILTSASELLAEHGYAGCSMAAVAARAGVAAGTVYKQFPSKADLVAELFRSIVTREVEAVRAAAAQSGSAAERTAAVIETFAGRALKHPRRAYALLSEPVDPPPQDATVVAAALVGAIGEALVGPLAAGREDPDTVPTLIQFAHRAVGGSQCR